MKKIIYVITGVSGSGKNKLIEIINEVCHSCAIDVSSVQPIKDWLINKMDVEEEFLRTSEGRKIISDIKISLAGTNVLDAYCIEQCDDQYEEAHNPYQWPLIFIQIREPADIKKFKEYALERGYVVDTIKVRREEAEKNIPDNDGDRLSMHVNADHLIYNNGSLEELTTRAYELLSRHYENIAISHRNARIDDKREEMNIA